VVFWGLRSVTVGTIVHVKAGHLLVEVAWYKVVLSRRRIEWCVNAARCRGQGAIGDVHVVIYSCRLGAAIQFSRSISSHYGGAWWQGFPSDRRLDGGRCRLRLGAKGGEGGDGEGGEEGRSCLGRRR